MERIKRSKILSMLLIIVFSISLFALLFNMIPTESRSVMITDEKTLSVMPSEDLPEEEDLVPLTTELSTNAKNWKPKKEWGRLSEEIEKAIAYNVRIANSNHKTSIRHQDRILLTAVANQGMAEYTLNWIMSLKNCGLDDKFLVFAIDKEIVKTLKEAGYDKHVILIPTEWFHKQLSDKFEAWLSSGYTPITHAKSLVVERLLYTNVTVWFSDVDIVFTSPSVYDYLVMKLNSRKETETLFSQETEQRIINSGFYVMRPTNTNKRILEESIYIQDTEQNKKPEVTQQRAMNRVLDDINLNYQTSTIALLDLMLFPHGRFYFDREMPTKFGLNPMIVHANYRKGDNKKKDLQKFGLCFNGICQTVALSLCPLIGQANGIEPVCYSRNIDLAGNLIFQPATLVIDIVAIIMTAIMIYHIRSKYTAVGRKEIVMFFYLYMITTFLEMLLVTGIIPTSSPVYPWFTAVHIGLICATFWCLLLNGFVGFQFAEDGTPLSLWSIRISSFVIFLLVGFIAIATFKQIGPFTYTSPSALWAFYFIINGVAFIIYVISQIILVVNTLDDRWPLGDILFGTAFFVIGQVILYIFSVIICDQIKHYIDGLFFGSICTLLAVMMVYKYWDSITKEDLEFSVGAKQNVWEVKELLAEDELAQNYQHQQQQQQQQQYGGGQQHYPQQQYPY
ncbi:chitin synthase III catalytic subunit-domain-containing protein [Cokeromyces recurvatus]|uniref:chitin synthase III catalytic subunit-domain-containing protein n=1 Tax=Cokeromyces recurvatus TaxID=90255 RepID=UPI002220C018|nr:chitin synthase III catalytic subunit-domain-containing protein [Cokeromyces recurvatus]KAI7904259.1 chitin synthase III catalytic subunit-domain-containing protein [Cokeromyces recurvatus]